MSNLSELLPTGGGQNAVDFVASGTLSSGQTVVLKTDGTVEAAAETAIPETVGSESVYEEGNAAPNSVAFDSSNNKIVIAYRDGSNSGYGTSVVGTVSGTSISFGTPVIFNSVSTDYTRVVFDSNASKVVIAYRGAVNRGKAIVGTVSGTSISFGTEAQFESGSTEKVDIAFNSSANKVVISYADAGNSEYGKAIVGTVSGTSISFGSETTFNSAVTQETRIAYDSNADKVVIVYKNQGNFNRGTAIVGTVSGTSISFGTPVVYLSATVESMSITYESNAQKVVIAYSDGTSGNYYGRAIVGTVSGTSISFGTQATIQSAVTSDTSISFDSNVNKVVVSYTEGSPTYAGSLRVGTVSGTSISFGSELSFNPATTDNVASTFDSNSNKIIIVYRDGDNSNYGTSVVFQNASTTTNYTDFIGITAEAISDTATGAVNVYGGINEAQTGLTIGSDYYVQDDGSLSTTASSVKVGQAISATTINMMDLT